MKRMTLSMICVLTFIGIALSASWAIEGNERRANAVVSFGQWETDLTPPLDRLLGDPGMGVGNNHELIPNIVRIKVGGSVNFIISGGHIPTVYDDGTQPEDINPNVTEPAANCPTTAGGVINDPTNRIYRGPCFSTNFGGTAATVPPTPVTTTIVRRDGVEVVKFTKPGTYLVICARKNHFVNDGMFGFVRVK